MYKNTFHNNFFTHYLLKLKKSRRKTGCFVEYYNNIKKGVKIMKFYKNTAYIFITGSIDDQTPNIALGALYDIKDKTIVFWRKGGSKIFYVDKLVKDEESKFEFIDKNGLRVSFHPVTLDDLDKYKDELFTDAPIFKTTEGLQNWLMQNNH